MQDYIAKFCTDRFFRNIHSGVGSRSVPVCRLTSWYADENVISFKFLKFSSRQMLQHLVCLNEDTTIALVIALR